MHDDSAIVDRLLDGDEAAFRTVFDSYFPRMYRFALLRVGGNADDARDVVQLTFCRAFERLGSWRGEASLYGWMLQICRNALIDRARQLDSRPHHLSLGSDDGMLTSVAAALRAPDDEQPDARAAREQLLQIIQATLDFLPSHYGDVLEWKYVEGESVNDIARRLQLAPKAAESLLTRARKAFREALSEIEHAADLLPFDIQQETTHARR